MYNEFFLGLKVRRDEVTFVGLGVKIPEGNCPKTVGLRPDFVFELLLIISHLLRANKCFVHFLRLPFASAAWFTASSAVIRSDFP